MTERPSNELLEALRILEQKCWEEDYRFDITICYDPEWKSSYD